MAPFHPEQARARKSGLIARDLLPQAHGVLVEKTAAPPAWESEGATISRPAIELAFLFPQGRLTASSSNQWSLAPATQ